MEEGPGLSPEQIKALFPEAADPAIAFLYDDKVRDALVAQLCEWTGCRPVWAHLALWAAQQAAAGITANGVQWVGSKAGGTVTALLSRCPGCGLLVAGLRRLLGRAREEAAFRDQIAEIARGERDPDPSRLPEDAPDDVRLALALTEEVRNLAGYLPGEFDALHDLINSLKDDLRLLLERIEAKIDDLHARFDADRPGRALPSPLLPVRLLFGR